MRLFLAIDIPSSVKTELEKQLFEMRKKYPQAQWIPKENFHITLHFLGEVEDAKKAAAKIEDALFESFAFHLYALKLDLFIHRTIVVHLGFRREKELERIAKKIKEKFQNDPARRFIPHLTLARSRISSKQQYFSFKKNIARVPIEVDFRVDTLYLFQTIFEENRPTYKKLFSFPLIKQRRS